jgi:hypothetical protein
MMTLAVLTTAIVHQERCGSRVLRKTLTHPSVPRDLTSRTPRLRPLRTWRRTAAEHAEAMQRRAACDALSPTDHIELRKSVGS